MSTTGIQDLPQSIQDIAEVIGRDKALILAERCNQPPSAGNGRCMGYVYIPKLENLRADHPLRQWLGDDDAEALCADFGGISLFPSKCKSRGKMTRNEQLRSDIKQGMTRKDAAAKYLMTERNVRNIVGTEANDQPDTKPELPLVDHPPSSRDTLGHEQRARPTPGLP